MWAFQTICPVLIVSNLISTFMGSPGLSVAPEDRPASFDTAGIIIINKDTRFFHIDPLITVYPMLPPSVTLVMSMGEQTKFVVAHKY